MSFLKELQPQNFLIMFLFSMKHLYLLTAKLFLTLINLIFTWCERATVGESLRVWRNIWCLIIASTKLMYYLCHDILLEINFYKKHQSKSFQFSIWTSQPQNVLNLLLFIINFPSRYHWKVLIKKFINEMN